MTAGSNKTPSIFRKYIGLLSVTAVFLIIVAVIFGFSMRATSEVARLRLISTTTATVSTELQVVSGSLGAAYIEGRALSTPAGQRALAGLERARNSVNQAIQGQESGGTETFIAWNDNKLKVPKSPTAAGQEKVVEFNRIWRPIDTEIGIFLESARTGSVDEERLLNLYNTMLDNNNELHNIITVLDKEGRKVSRGYSETSANLQKAGIVLSIVYFLLVTGYFIRRLAKSDRQLAAARHETENIMATVNEGLFLVDSDLKVADQYSRKMESLIQQENLGGMKLDDMLSKIVPPEDSETTGEFIEQLFNERVNENLVNDLNPLSRIPVISKNTSGTPTTSYLDFQFSRVYEGNKITRILGTVSDVTNAVLLEKHAETEREQGDVQIEMMLAILNTDINMLRDFAQNSRQRMDTINKVLESTGYRQEDFRAALERIYREVHSLKGESSALRFHVFVNLANQFEERIKALQNQSALSGDDFLPLVVLLDKLIALHQTINQLINRLSQIAHTPAVQANAMTRYFDNFVHDVAARNRKEITFDSEGLDRTDLDARTKSVVKDITTQLLRNAVVHGIENSREREREGKAAAGNVKVRLIRKSDGTFALSVEDDGGGINFDKLRDKAVQLNLCSREDAQKMSKQQLAKVMFEQGVSTADTANEDAGRGVGMDVIKERVREIGGKLMFATQSGRGTRFTVNFPAP